MVLQYENKFFKPKRVTICNVDVFKSLSELSQFTVKLAMKFQAFFLWFLITLWIITLVIVILKGEKLYHLVILISLIYRLQILKHLIWLLDRFIFYLFFQIFFKSVFYLFSSFSLFTLIWYLSITPLHFIGFYLFIICVTTRMKVPESEDFAFLIYF